MTGFDDVTPSSAMVPIRFGARLRQPARRDDGVGRARDPPPGHCGSRLSSEWARARGRPPRSRSRPRRRRVGESYPRHPHREVRPGSRRQGVEPRRADRVGEALGQWARSIETGASSSSADATEAAEWVRQYLALKIETGDVQLPRAQSKVADEVLQNLLLMFELGAFTPRRAAGAVRAQRADVRQGGEARRDGRHRNAFADEGAAGDDVRRRRARLGRSRAERRRAPADGEEQARARILNRLLLPPCGVDDSADETEAEARNTRSCAVRADFNGASAEDHLSATVRDLCTTARSTSC